MEKSLELYSNGRLYEYVGAQPIRMTDTQAQVSALIEALQFSTAKTFTIAPLDKPLPDVPSPRGGRRINHEGLKLLTTFEGCELEAYDDKTGVWTIGYGHTKGVVPGMKITQAQAEQFLQEDLEKFSDFVENAVEIDVNDDQFSALVCFCFNIGAGGLGSSTLLRMLNAGDLSGASEQFLRWNKVENGEPWLGLTRRRLAEQALFRSQDWRPALSFDGEVSANGTGSNRTLKLATPPLQGEDVRRVQEALLKVGFSLGSAGADGFFGQATDTALRQLQQQKGLTVDGVVGSQTLQALGL
jgi:lysozyme